MAHSFDFMRECLNRPNNLLKYYDFRAILRAPKSENVTSQHHWHFELQSLALPRFPAFDPSGGTCFVQQMSLQDYVASGPSRIPDSLCLCYPGLDRPECWDMLVYLSGSDGACPLCYSYWACRSSCCLSDLRNRSVPWTVLENYPCFAWWPLCYPGGSVRRNDGPLPPWFCLTCLSEAELIDSPVECDNNCTTSSPPLISPLPVMIWRTEEERRVFRVGRRRSVSLLVWR